MPSPGTKAGTQHPEAYELLTRDGSLQVPNGSSTMQPLANDDERPSMHRRRSRFSHSRSDDGVRGDEVVGLLTSSTFEFPKKFRSKGGLGVALELITQSTPSLLAAVVGSVMTGVVFDQVQFWPAFTRIGELFILVPILLNLKGCLEMNLASRLSTSVFNFTSAFLIAGEYWRIGH